jgi:hypothetical protein
VREIKIEGDKLYIESPAMPHPNINNKIVRVIVEWERERDRDKKCSWAFSSIGNYCDRAALVSV